MRSSAQGDTYTLCLRIVSRATPPATHEGADTEFGLPDKKLTLDAGVQQPDGTLRFECSVQVRHDPAMGRLRFGGPFAHGPATDQFLYLGWRIAGTPDHWIRRWKLSLDLITVEQVQAATATPQGCLQATLGTLDKTRPTMEGAGWTLVTPA